MPLQILNIYIKKNATLGKQLKQISKLMILKKKIKLSNKIKYSFLFIILCHILQSSSEFFSKYQVLNFNFN